MHILVAGGAGYIGSHVCKALKQGGFTPIVYDNLQKGHRWAVRWGPLVCADLHDKGALTAVLRHYKPSVVIHLASYINVRESHLQPAMYYHNNVDATVALLETMAAEKIPSLIFSSTAAVYGNPVTSPIAEDHPKNPINPYGKSKWMAEQIIDDIAAAQGISTVIFRYFNAAGADPEGEIGEAHDPETHLIPLVIQTALKQRPELTLYGTDHPTPDGTAIRDYIHVTDLAIAHVQAVSWLQTQSKSLKLNLGTGHGYSVKEVLNSVGRSTGKTIPFVVASRSPSDPPFLVANANLAKEILSWKTQYSDLTTIVETACRWHTSQSP